MALTAKVLRVHVELSDIDRGVYESLDLRVAQHPSEQAERVVLRVLGYALLYQEGIAFGRGLSTVEDAAVHVTGFDGQIALWVDVGAPSAERLHKASKAAAEVAVITDRDDATLSREWKSKKVHQADQVTVWRLDSRWVKELASDVAPKWDWTILVQEGAVMVTRGDRTTSAEPVRTSVGAFQA